MAGKVCRGRPRTAECPLDGASCVFHLFGLDIGRQWPLAPVVGNTPPLEAELVEEGSDLVGPDGHALRIVPWFTQRLPETPSSNKKASHFLHVPVLSESRAKFP